MWKNPQKIMKTNSTFEEVLGKFFLNIRILSIILKKFQKIFGKIMSKFENILSECWKKEEKFWRYF